MQRNFHRSIVLGFLILLGVPGTDLPLAAQNDSTNNSRKVFSGSSAEKLQPDSLRVIEVAPLDIGESRGLYIVAPDGKMQMRILGSVRYLAVYDNIELENKNALNTYQIPTGERNDRLPNYYNGLDQTRLGFEVTRRTSRGDIFGRLETDFAGNGFRIRHAYAQFRHFLFGQTWSLFSQITALPATVDFLGPTGAIPVRNPQIRYSPHKPVLEMNLAVGLEYMIPDLNIPDSLLIKSFQLIPDITVRLDKTFGWGYLQLSGILPVISARENAENLILKTGWGVAASTIINAWTRGKWYLQAQGGRAIARFSNTLGGNGLDVIIDPEGNGVIPLTYGGYLTYEHHWKDNLFSSLSYGMAGIEEHSFLSDDMFRRGSSIRLNTFWDLVEGAKLGGELVWGQRVDKGGLEGEAFRMNLLVYYDF